MLHSFSTSKEIHYCVTYTYPLFSELMAGPFVRYPIMKLHDDKDISQLVIFNCYGFALA